MKVTVVVNLHGSPADLRPATWVNNAKEWFRPVRVEHGTCRGDPAEFLLCEVTSADAIRTLVLETRGAIVRKVNKDIDVGVELGDYGNHVLEVPSIDKPELLKGPPGTFQVMYMALPDPIDRLQVPDDDDHTKVVLQVNNNGENPDVNVAIFVFASPHGSERVRIPTTLEEAVNVLMENLSPENLVALAATREEHLAGQTHMNLGMAIRNGWKLWDAASPLMRHFPGKDPDDVSGIIIEAVWRKLHEPR